MEVRNCNRTTFTSTKFAPKTVDSRLIRGRSSANILNLYKLKHSGVTQIIDLRDVSTEHNQLFSKILEKINCKILNIKYKNHPYSHKSEQIPEMTFFEAINDSILKNEGKTYIHCRHGKRRTGICVAIYEIFHTNKSKTQIFDEFSNIGFKELKENVPDIPQKTYKRLVNIYNNFLKIFYPQKPLKK